MAERCDYRGELDSALRFVSAETNACPITSGDVYGRWIRSFQDRSGDHAEDFLSGLPARRQPVPGKTGLHQALRKHVANPKQNIFIDVDNIPVGVDFVEHLDTQVTQCGRAAGGDRPQLAERGRRVA